MEQMDASGQPFIASALFRRVWAKLVRKPFVRSAHVFCCIVSLHRCNGKRLPKEDPTVAREAPEKPDRASTFRGALELDPQKEPGALDPMVVQHFPRRLRKIQRERLELDLDPRRVSGAVDPMVLHHLSHGFQK